MKRIYLFLLCLTIFLIPSNLFYKLDVSHAYVHGMLVDYLIPKISASDLPMLVMLGLWCLTRFWHRSRLKNKPEVAVIKDPSILIFLLFIILLGARQFFTQNVEASWWWLLKLGEMGLFVWFLKSHRTIFQDFQNRWLWITLTGTLLFQAVTGILQFYRQQSVFPSYLFLGEVNFNHSIGLAKDNYFHTANILAYGTTSHPNVLAGFIVLGGLLLLKKFGLQVWQGSWWQKLLALIIASTLLWTLVLTQSIAAVLCLLIGLGVIIGQKFWCNLGKTSSTKFKYIVFICLCLSSLFIVPELLHLGSLRFPNNQSFTRRDTLNRAALAMIEHQPIFGVGLDNFTVNLEKYSQSKEIVRFIQPAHNVLILWIAETGLLGILIGVLVIWRMHDSMLLPLLILLPLMTLDHYLFTQQTGLLLAIFYIGGFNWRFAQDRGTTPHT